MADKPLIKTKKPQNNDKIILRKKSIDNGDLSKHIPSELKNKRRVKPLTITQKRNKDTNDYLNSVKTVKDGQENLKRNLNEVPFDSKNKFLQSNPNPSRKLPKTFKEIDENEDLVKLLIKNPNDMTPQEKRYIASFNDEEFKTFVGFLKMKNKELSWRGNDWGSGRYLDNHISIYRPTGHSENEKFLSLKKFINMNYQNAKAEEGNRVVYQENTTDNKFISDDNFTTGNMTTPLPMIEKKLSRYNVGLSTLNENKQKTYEDTAKTLLNEMENFKNVILDYKNKANLDKTEMQNQILINDMEDKSRQLNNHISNYKNKQSLVINDIDHIYEKFKKSLKNKDSNKNNTNLNVEDYSLIKKIQNYLLRMNLSVLDFIYKLDIDSIINSSISLSRAKESLVKLKVFDEAEAEDFCGMLRLYHGENIRNEYIECIIKAEVYDDIKEILKENEEEGGESEEEINENDYDYFSLDVDKRTTGTKNEEKKRKLKSYKVLQDYEYLVKKKAATHIQRVFRGKKSRRKTNVFIIYINMLVRRITKQLRAYAEKRRTIKNESAHKITYLMRKHYIKKHLNIKLTGVTEKWLIGKGVNLSNSKFSHKNKVRCAIYIQRAWKAYKEKLMKRFFDKNSTTMDINMLKTKTCFICLLNRVTHLCRDCENNHYCESCFLKFHIRGTKRNHSYLKIKSIMEEFKKKKEKLSIVAGAYNEISIVKNYLEHNQINLYEILQMWDFKKNNTILYKHLKDALNVRGFKFDPNIRDLILNLALKFVVQDNNKLINLDNSLVNYEAFWLELV